MSADEKSARAVSAEPADPRIEAAARKCKELFGLSSASIQWFEDCAREVLAAADAVLPLPPDALNAQVMFVQMPTGIHNERLMNERLSDANAAGWRAYAMRDHNGLLVFILGHQDGAEQKVVMSPPDEQFEQPINARLAKEHADGWSLLAMENHSGFLVFLLEREPPMAGEGDDFGSGDCHRSSSVGGVVIVTVEAQQQETQT